jgi:hypothetical protein
MTPPAKLELFNSRDASSPWIAGWLHPKGMAVAMIRDAAAFPRKGTFQVDRMTLLDSSFAAMVSPQIFQSLAALVLSIHAAYIAWIIFGAVSTRHRPRLAVVHIATLIYGAIVELFDLSCPLTLFENWLEARGGVSPYRGSFLLHYLDALVYPAVPPSLLTLGAIAVCGLNLWIYARRLRAHRSLG